MCRCRYIWYVVVVVVGLYRYKRVTCARARAYTPPRAWLSSRVHIKKAKKTLEHPATFSYILRSVRKPTISDAP
nr:MAG TPA_asm: hypothetical protein [Caudoviricetes sp.]